MLRTFLQSKIHRATVTRCNLDYVGSVTIDADLLRASGMLPNEAVTVLDLDNGARFETYVILGEAGSGEIGINGAAAHLTEVGHKVILLTYAQLTHFESPRHASTVVVATDDNRVGEVLTYPCTLPDAPAAADLPADAAAAVTEA